MAKKDKDKIQKLLDRGQENLENSINESFAVDPIVPGQEEVDLPQEVTQPQYETFARPSAADRISEMVERERQAAQATQFTSLADRAEREAKLTRARQQSEMAPSIADRVEREINLRMEELLTPTERVEFSPAAVQEANIAEEEALRAAEEGRVTTKPREEREPLATGFQVSDPIVEKFIAEQRAQQTIDTPPVQSLKGQTERKSFVLENYPTLMAAAARTGLSDNETRDLVNFTLAFDAANIIGRTLNPERQAAFFATMSEPMQALVQDIILAGIEEDKERGLSPREKQDRVEEAKRRGQELFDNNPVGEYVAGAVGKAIEQQKIISEDSTGNTTQDILRSAWNWSLGPAFDAWFTAAENFQRGVRAASLYGAPPEPGETVSRITGPGTYLGTYPTWSEAWAAAERGQYSQERLDEVKKIYGEKPVNLIVEIRSAYENGEADVIGEMIQRYQDDPEMLDFIDKAINGVRDDQEMADLITSVRFAETGDTGNVFYNSRMELLFSGVGPELSREPVVGDAEHTATYSAVRNSLNVASIFFLDPLIVAGAGRAAILSARYGLARVALEANAPVKGTTVFQERSVRRFMGTLGRQLNDVSATEATQGVAAMAPKNASVRTMYKRFFTPDALDDMRIYLKSKPDANPAAALEEYFSNIENIQKIIVGQSAKRGKAVQVPHMTAATARVKLASLKARGLTYPRTDANEFLDNVFYEGFSSSMPAEAADDFARIISGPDGDQYVGRGLSDFALVDGEMTRNLMGRIVLDRLPDSKFTRRYGWKRVSGPKATAARLRRLAAIWPDTSKPLKVSDASDAGRVQQLVEAAGMPRHFSQIVREMWVASDEPTRRLIGEGLARSYGYARGVDVVSQEGKAMIKDIGPGAARGDQYAASTVDIAALRVQAKKEAQDRIDRSAFEIEPITRNVDDLANDILNNELLPNASPNNPAVVKGQAGAIVLSDTTEYMAFPNINRLERFSARSSLLTALTGQNIAMNNITDLWVLGTLAGPRFQLRNALEDMGLYILTAGGLRNYFKGRKFSTARREAQARPADQAFQEIKGMKLGSVKTVSRNIGNLFSDEMAAIILPNLSKQDLKRANALAAEGKREALAKLVAKAYLRQRLKFLPGRFRVIGRTVDETKLSAEQLQELRWLEQAVENGDVLHALDEAAETGRHLADGFPARSSEMNDPGVRQGLIDQDMTFVNGQSYKVHRFDVKYENRPVIPGANDNGMKGWYHNLAKLVHGDGIKGQWAMELLPRYHAAMTAGKMDEAKAIVDELAARLAGADPKLGYGSKFMIQKLGGFEALAKSTLDFSRQLMTTSTGRFNRELYARMRYKTVADDGTEEVSFALWNVDEAGEQVNLLSLDELAELSTKTGAPATVNARVTTEILEPIGGSQWTSGLWNMMGRSLARMTREPIFTANYLDARKIMAPFEKKLAKDLGESAAEKWAVEAATERAYRLTMNYVDNPSIRSQFAWQIRNVARFYRALEDFNRRMIRTTRNNPMAFAKLALGWNVLDESGFTYEDEFGEKYFVWPGTRQAFEAINGVFNMLGQEVYSPSLPLSLTSRVNMLTPSADPNALIPTFSGPYAAMALLPMVRSLPGLSQLEDEFFGEYTKGRSYIDTVFPPHIVRVLGAYGAFDGRPEDRLDETDTMFASAARSAAQAYAAAGLWKPDEEYDPEQISKHRERIDRTAQWMVGIKLLFSPILPAAYSVNVDTSTEFAKTLGLDGLRPAFIQLIKANDGDYSAASVQWLKTNPDLSPFMVGTTKAPDSKGYYGPFQETVDWIESNQDALDISVIGSSYFAPTEGKRTLPAWQFMMSNGYTARQTTNDYINELIGAEGKAQYYKYRQQWKDLKAAGDKNADYKWDKMKEILYADYPMLRRSISGSLSDPQRSVIDDMVSEVDSIRKVANYLDDQGKLDQRGKDVKRLVKLRDQAAFRLQELNENAPNYSKQSERLREQWKQLMTLENTYYDDLQWSNLLYVLSESLVQGWGRYA